MVQSFEKKDIFLECSNEPCVVVRVCGGNPHLEKPFALKLICDVIHPMKVMSTRDRILLINQSDTSMFSAP